MAYEGRSRVDRLIDSLFARMGAARQGAWKALASAIGITAPDLSGQAYRTQIASAAATTGLADLNAAVWCFAHQAPFGDTASGTAWLNSECTDGLANLQIAEAGITGNPVGTYFVESLANILNSVGSDIAPDIGAAWGYAMGAPPYSGIVADDAESMRATMQARRDALNAVVPLLVTSGAGPMDVTVGALTATEPQMTADIAQACSDVYGGAAPANVSAGLLALVGFTTPLVASIVPKGDAWTPAAPSTNVRDADTTGLATLLATVSAGRAMALLKGYPGNSATDEYGTVHAWLLTQIP